MAPWYLVLLDVIALWKPPILFWFSESSLWIKKSHKIWHPQPQGLVKGAILCFRNLYFYFWQGEGTSTASQLTSLASQKSKDLNKVPLLLQDIAQPPFFHFHFNFWAAQTSLQSWKLLFKVYQGSWLLKSIHTVIKKS